MSSERNPVIDMMKGLAIALVVVGHSLPFGSWTRDFIYVFHLPLFFFVSGYCFKEKYLCDCRTFVRHRIKGLWWPFVKYGVPMVLLHNVFCALHLYGPLCDEAPYTLRQTGAAVLKQFAMSGAEPLLGTYWFLNTLFGASLLFYVCRRTTNKGLTIAILTAGAAACLLLMPHMGGLRIVFRMFFAGAYMALGHWCAGVSMQRLSGRMAILPLGVLVGVSVGFLPHEMTGATLPTMLPCMAAAMAGILMCWGLCRWLLDTGGKAAAAACRALEYVGCRTLTVMTWHLLSFKAVTLLIIALYGLPLGSLEAIPILNEQADQGWWLAYTAAGVSVVLLRSGKKL